MPDDAGFVRVLDVAAWGATKAGQVESMSTLLEARPEVWNKYEDGQFVDLAVAQGGEELLRFLLKHKFPVGSAAMAHAAKHGNLQAMEVGGSFLLCLCVCVLVFLVTNRGGVQKKILTQQQKNPKKTQKKPKKNSKRC